MPPTTDKRQTAFAADVSFGLFGGLMTMTADPVPIRRPNVNKSDFVTICKECEEPSRLREQFVCDHGHGPFRRGEGRRAIDHGSDTYEPVDEDAVRAATTPDLPEKQLAFEVFLADTCRELRPDEFCYRVRPSKKTPTNLYSLLLELLGDPKYVLIGEANFKNAQRMFRLERWGDMLVIQSLIRPEDVAPAEEVEKTLIDQKTLKMAKAWLAENAQEFDPEQFRSQRRIRIEALKATNAGAEIVELPKRPAPEPEIDLASALEASLAAAGKKSRKTAPKTTARRKAS